MNTFRQKFPIVGLVLFGALSIGVGEDAQAHDVSLPLKDLDVSARRIYKTLAYLRSRPIKIEKTTTDEEYRRALGAAGIEKSMNNPKRALAILMSRLNEKRFKNLPQYVDALLMASELLEASDKPVSYTHLRAHET